MDEIARLFNQSVDCSVVHLQQSATLALVNEKSFGLHGNHSTVAARKFEPVRLLISF